MDKVFIIANWKSNKTSQQAKEWFGQLTIDPLRREASNLQLNNKEIVICPPFTLLPILKEKAGQLGVKLGSQDISPFEQGAYTGEVNGEQIKEFADYVIIGHSERREDFGENDEDLSKKVDMAIKYNLIPLFCIQGKETSIPSAVKVVAYEPVFAIGSGKPDTPESANEVASYVKKEGKAEVVLYGGSVTAQNVKNFTSMEHINGVLVGEASLSPVEFSKIVNEI